MNDQSVTGKIRSGRLQEIWQGALDLFVKPECSGIDSSMRATIDSFQSLGLRAAIIIVGLGFGYFSSGYDIFGGYGFISLICGVFLVFFLVSSKYIREDARGSEQLKEN